MKGFFICFFVIFLAGIVSGEVNASTETNKLHIRKTYLLSSSSIKNNSPKETIRRTDYNRPIFKVRDQRTQPGVSNRNSYTPNCPVNEVEGLAGSLIQPFVVLVRLLLFPKHFFW